jgi:hypothetical protein
MPADFRSDPMATPEGAGKARKAWEAYSGLVNRHVTPFIKPAVDPVARSMVEDLIGFWVMWQLYGGFEGLEEFGMHKSTIWRKIARFRKMTGEHPDVFEMPGVTIDPKAYWVSEVKKVGRPPQS